MPSRNPYGCVFWPTYLLPFLGRDAAALVRLPLAARGAAGCLRLAGARVAACVSAPPAFATGAAPHLTDHEPRLARRLADGPLNRPGFHGLRLRGRLGGGGGLGLALLRGALGAVAAEQPRRRELPELVPHHVLGDVHRDELVPVVHRQSVAHEVRRDRAAPGPRLEHLLLVLLVQDPDLLEERRLHVRALLDRACHYCVAFPRF